MYGNGGFLNSSRRNDRNERYGQGAFNPIMNSGMPARGVDLPVQSEFDPRIVRALKESLDKDVMRALQANNAPTQQTSFTPTLQTNVGPTQQTNMAPTLLANSGRRTRPHCTGYTRELENVKFCRCANPTVHGDAFTRPDCGSNYTGISIRDLNSQIQSWEEFTHRQLDMLGKDYATELEMQSVRSQVFHPDTVAELAKKRANRDWLIKRGHRVTSTLPHGTIWWGPTNPKGVLVAPPPGQGGSQWRHFIGANGMWDTAETRPTQRGLTWGASQYAPGGASRR